MADKVGEEGNEREEKGKEREEKEESKVSAKWQANRKVPTGGRPTRAICCWRHGPRLSSLSTMEPRPLVSSL